MPVTDRPAGRDALRLARHLSRNEIPTHTAQGAAIAQARLAEEARLIERLAAATDVSVADLARRAGLHKPEKADLAPA